MDKQQQEDFAKAKELYQEEKWQEAANIFLNLYGEIEDDELAVLTAKTLCYSRQYTLAYQIVFQSMNAFRNDISFVVEVGIKSQHFISTRILIRQQPIFFQEKELPRLTEAEENYHEQFREIVKSRLRSFYHLGDYPFDEQRQRLLSADQLPLEDFITGAVFLLRDPFTHQFIKAEILNELQQVGYKKKITMLCVDGKEHHFIPNELPLVYENPIFVKCQEILREKLAQVDPQLYTMLSGQLNIQLILLNPLINEVITDPNAWINVMLRLATGEEINDDSETILNWQQKLNKFLDELQ